MTAWRFAPLEALPEAARAHHCLDRQGTHRNRSSFDMFQLFGSENVYSGTNLAGGLQTGQLWRRTIFQIYSDLLSRVPCLFFQGVWQAALWEYAAFAVNSFNREALFGFCVDPNPKRPSSDGFFKKNVFAAEATAYQSEERGGSPEVHFGYCAWGGVFLKWHGSKPGISQN